MSGAFQAPPHHPTSVSALQTPPLNTASPVNRQYSPGHPSPTQEYYANQHQQQQQHQQQTSRASPASSSPRHPSRRPSATNDYLTDRNSPMSSRVAGASPAPVPVSSAAASPDFSTSSQRRNMPAAAVPPRTSSSRRAPASERSTDSSSRRTHGDSNREANGRIDPADEAALQSSRNRRASSQANNTYDPRTNSSAPVPVRSPPVTTNSAKGPSKEASDILNSILISQPEVDIEREKERLAQAQPHQPQTMMDDDAAPPPIVAAGHHGEETRRGGRSRHDHSKREKHTKFGEYILGNTIGEGEFGKVKLGWKQEGGVQVAIKLIKKDQLGSNPSRMAKIMREVAILKQLTHPNIVRLHKMEESERHYGIVLEYASGGELFDYILNHRYLKDNAARRLFAQLVSGVGYLHKKGIVHRDLKLENLLLDRNRNIIITDFGFANTFDPAEELSEEEELNLTDREFVKRMGLDRVKPSGSRKGDLMQTSCGSPCYAAPELVVSDSLYTGRKVDVWSCGVILYAMLAGYLPFDDDPANPEGDNINLLYKYIVNTPLTFPEYVTPHARDLLRRILVPNPRKRADLFEVARHSWLSEYAHVVEFITSSTTTPGEIQNTTVPSEDDAPGLGRSASVRESSKKTTGPPALGGLATKQGTIDAEAEAYAKQQRDNKRRTVQVEYVAPNTQTQRGEASSTQSSGGRTRARSGSQGAVEVVEQRPGSSSSPKDKTVAPAPKENYGKPPVSSRRPPSAHRNVNSAAAAVRTGGRDARATSETAFFGPGAPSSNARPNTGGSVQSLGSRGAGNRSSYGQPAPPELADTNAHGKIQQPPSRGKNSYGMPSTGEAQNVDYGRPSISAIPPKFARVSGFEGSPTGSGTNLNNNASQEGKGHKRSSTMGEISGKLFGRSGSLFGGRNRKRQQEQLEKNKRYPPVSMNNTLGAEESRTSMDSKRSRRSYSIGLGNKRSGSISGSQGSQQEKQNRRFSFMPAGFSFKSMGISKEEPSPALDSQQDLPIQEPPTVDQYGRYVEQDVDREHVDASTLDGMYAQLQGVSRSNDQYGQQQQRQQQQQQQQRQEYSSNQYDGRRPSNVEGYQSQTLMNSSSDHSIDNNMRRPAGSAPQLPHLSPQDTEYDGRKVASGGRPGRGVLQKNKRFVDAWDSDGYSRGHDHSGSSGPARKVMDFFRRRGKARTGELN
ncbi:putative serine/threonine-protein kinase [Triangularia verruculosa]|uniref:non-specific serine/threonine protein kinase n=1 Tax=Triangularia verruculosa TaxID=2587418 RepID=A0AAN6XUM5_9PEZI|nr:putative serine/threonine-protein kinase [Triangularia verruculosa]